MGPPKFTEIEDEQLITHVKGYPCLYDQRDKDFRNTVLKACSWKEISEAVGRDVENCKRRWKDMRDNYFKIKRHNKKRPKWLLFPVLSFLDEVHHRERKPYNNTDTVDETSLDYYPPNSVECSIEESPSSVSLEDGDEEEREEDTTTRKRTCISYPPIQSIHRSEFTNADIVMRKTSIPPVPPGIEKEVRETDSKKSCLPHKRNHGKEQLELPEIITTINERRDQVEELDFFIRSLATTMESVPASLTANIMLSSRKKKEEDEEDDVDSFMRSIAKILKTLPPQKIARAKMSILSIVTELQFAETSETTTVV